MEGYQKEVEEESHITEGEPELQIPKDAKEINRDMILGNLPNSIRRPNMTKKEILDTMTHLHLQQKKISNINVVAGKKYLAGGELKAYGIAAEKRSDQIPDLPTLKEQGVDLA